MYRKVYLMCNLQLRYSHNVENPPVKYCEGFINWTPEIPNIARKKIVLSSSSSRKRRWRGHSISSVLTLGNRNSPYPKTIPSPLYFIRTETNRALEAEITMTSDDNL